MSFALKSLYRCRIPFSWLFLLLLFLPSTSRASSILWFADPPNCDQNQMQCPAAALIDGEPAASMADGGVDLGPYRDGQEHILTLQTRACPGSVTDDYDDFGSLKVYLEHNGQSLLLAQDLAFGDNCGSLLTYDIPFQLQECDCDSGTSAPVWYATGQMQTNPQLDFVLDDPFLPVRFERTYATYSLLDGVLGWGWKHNYDITLEEVLSEPSYFEQSNSGVTLLEVPYQRLVDNDSGGGAYERDVTIVGDWTVSSNGSGYIKPNYLHDNNQGKGSKSVRFQPTLAHEGEYEVVVRYAPASNRASNVPVLIHHAEGETLQSVNMRSGSKKSLGFYRFEKGNQGYVEIQTGGSNGYVIADAVIFKLSQPRSLDGRVKLEDNLQNGGYDLFYPDGTIYHFDDSTPHRLESIEEPQGHKLLFSYDAGGLLQTLTTPAGRVVNFHYQLIGGQSRLESISSAGQSLVQYSYTTVAEDGVEGRLKEVFYPQQGSGYRYSYSAIDGEWKRLERVEDLSGRLIEEHLWGYDSTGYRIVVTSTTTGTESLEFDYQTFWSGSGGGGQRKVTVTRHIEAQTSESYEVSFDAHGRVTSSGAGCSGCSEQVEYDWAGNAILHSDASGRTFWSRYDNLGNKLSEAEVLVEPQQPVVASEEFEGESLDTTKWRVRASGRGMSRVEVQEGTLHLEIRQGSQASLEAGVVSRFSLQGDFDISLRYSGMLGAAQGNHFLFGVTTDPLDPLGSGSSYVAVEQDENDGWRRRMKPAGGSTSYGADEGNVWMRRSVLRIVRSGDTFHLYRDGSNSLGSYTLSMSQQLYLFALVKNFNDSGSSDYKPLALDVEEILLASGTALGDLYTEVPGTRRSWEYGNPLLPRAVTRHSEPSAFPGLEKVTIYDYDDPASDSQPSVPNSEPTRRLYRIIEQGYTDADHDGVAELQTRTTSYSYYGPGDPDGLEGQLESIDGPLANDTTLYRYDAQGQLLSVTNPLGQVVSYAAYDAFGRATQLYDVNGMRTDRLYSQWGQVLSETFDPGGMNLTRSFSYEGELRLESVSAKGLVTEYEYDAYRRLTGLVRRAAVGGAELERAVYSYNLRGERTLEEFRDGAGGVHFSLTRSYGRGVDPSDGVERAYVSEEVPAGSGQVTVSYLDEAGRPVTRQDPSGHLTLYGYDAEGRLVTVTEKSVSDGQGGVVDHVTSYTYDERGNLASVTDPEGLVTSYLYDDFGNLLEVDSPDSGLTWYSYDLAGRLVERREAVGTADEQTTAYAYDEVGRLLGVAYQSLGRDVDYYYDGLGDGGGTSVQCNGYSVPLPQSYAEGRLSAVAVILDPAANEKLVTTYEYDARGLLVFERKYWGSAEPHVTVYTYDADGNIEEITYPRGLVVDYHYDGADPGRVSRMTGDIGSGPFDLATNITYEPFGDVAALSYGNGLSLSLTRDLGYRLQRVEVPGVLYRDYGRDGRGNITSVGYSPTTTDKTFSYDEVSRLVGASGPFGSYSYRFDRNGNRLEVDEGAGPVGYQYWPGTNQVSGVGGMALQYDGLGRLVGKGTEGLFWGADGRLLSYNGALGTTEFLHLPDGRRMEKLPEAATGEPVVLYHYDQAGNLITETYLTDPVADQENVTLEYVYLGTHRLAVVASQGPSGGYVTVVQAPGGGAGGGPWYAGWLPWGEGAVVALWGFVGSLGLVLLFIGFYRQRPELAAGALGLLVAGGALWLWAGAVPGVGAIPLPSWVYFFHNGHLGQPLALTDSQGAVVWSTDYKPYGELWNEQGGVTIGDPQTTGLVYRPRFRYPGQYEDPETGLFYNHWRYYQPELGNYTRPDPIIDVYPDMPLQSYIYTKSNPIVFLDPGGLYVIDPYFPMKCRSKLEDAIRIVRNSIAKNPKCNGCDRDSRPNLLDILDSPNTVFIYAENQPSGKPCAYGFSAPISTPESTHDWTARLQPFITPFACRMGRWMIARAIIHELTHINGEMTENRALEAEKRCGFPPINKRDFYGCS